MHPFIWLKTKPNFSIGFWFPLCCNRPLQIAYTYSRSFCIGTLTRFGPKAMLQFLTGHIKLIKKVKMGVWAYDAVPYMCILDFTEMGYSYTTWKATSIMPQIRPSRYKCHENHMGLDVNKA